MRQLDNGELSRMYCVNEQCVGPSDVTLCIPKIIVPLSGLVGV
jgi:hypothetical protein